MLNEIVFAWPNLFCIFAITLILCLISQLFQLLRHSLGRPDFLSCARLAGAVPIRFLRRTARLSSLEDLVRVIEEDLRPDPGLN